jgi:hypothetical protein
MLAFDDLVKRAVDEGDVPRRNHFGRVTVYTNRIGSPALSPTGMLC